MKERQREARQDWILMRVTTVILVLTAAAVLVIISLIIATHSWPQSAANSTRRVRTNKTPLSRADST